MIRREKTEKVTESRPSPAQLKAWEQDETTQWIFKRLHASFPDYRQLLPVKNHEDALIVNYRVGTTHVFRAIERLVEHGEI